jgi:Outer membrane protein (OmpH-like)
VALAALAFAPSVLGGCSADVHSASVRGAAYVRIDDVVKHHPLYPQLAQLDDAIAAISLEASAPHVPLNAAQIGQQTKDLNNELRAAQDRANNILTQKQQDYSKREQQAIAAALAAAGVSGAGAYAAQSMSATSGQQAQSAAAAANQDFMAYQQSVIAQDNAASSAVAAQLQRQASQKYRAKAEQLQQNETDLSLQLTQQDSAARLSIKTRLSNLAFDDATRKQLQSQLAAINDKESKAIDAQRSADQATLNAYQKQLNEETGNAIRSQVASVNAQTRAKILERRDEVGAQIRGLGAPALPPNLPPGTQAKLAAIHRQFQEQFQADAQKTIQDYGATKADLDRQFQALHGADVGATGAAAKELDALQKRRGDLYKQIVDQIQREANSLAKDRGFTIVFVSVSAAAGGYDMTNDLIKNVESLHE